MTTRAKIFLTVLALVLLGAVVFHYRESINKESIIRFGKGVPAAWLIGGFLVLPLLGVPISLFLVLCGLRFGLAGGMAATAACIAFHHCAAYFICRSRWSASIRRYVAEKGWDLPNVDRGRAIGVTALFASVHGPPYTLKLYLLALAEPPFWIYLVIGGGCYLIFSLIPVGAAAAAVKIDPTWIYLIVGGVSAVFLLKSMISKKKKNQENSSR